MTFEKQFPSTVLGAILLMICSFLITVPCYFFSDYLLISVDQASIDRFIVFIVFLFFLFFAYLMNGIKGNAVIYSFKLPSDLSFIILSVCVVIALQIGINLILTSGINTLLNHHYPLTNPFKDNAFSLLSTILLAPDFEELIFRGTILKGFLSNYSAAKSIAYSAAIFGLIHYAPATVVCAILLGLFFGWIYYQTGSVSLTILLHITANVTALVGMYVRFQIADHERWFNIYGKYSWFIVLLSILLLMVGFIKLLSQSKKGSLQF